MGLTVIATAFLPFSVGIASTTGLMALMAFGQSVAFPNVSALISRNSEADRQGQVLGLNNATGALARVAGPLCAGLVFSGISVNGPFWMGAAIVAPAIFLALAAGRAVKRANVLS
jgi:predicted MFS family arabinose efflux permease